MTCSKPRPLAKNCQGRTRMLARTKDRGSGSRRSRHTGYWAPVWVGGREGGAGGRTSEQRRRVTNSRQTGRAASASQNPPRFTVIGASMGGNDDCALQGGAKRNTWCVRHSRPDPILPSEGVVVFWCVGGWVVVTVGGAGGGDTIGLWPDLATHAALELESNTGFRLVEACSAKPNSKDRCGRAGRWADGRSIPLSANC